MSGGSMEQKREKWIDFVKVIAIFIVLLNHAGVRIPGVNFWGGMFFVPVFFVLSGYTYETKKQSYQTFAVAKAKRLLLPYFTANAILLLFFVCKDAIIRHDINCLSWEGILGIFYARNQLCLRGREPHVLFYQYLNAPTWFLPALFLTLLLFDALMRKFRGHQGKVFGVLFGLYVLQNVYFFFSKTLLPWSVDSLPLFGLLMQAGYCLKTYRIFPKLLDRGNRIVKAAALICTAIFIGTAIYNGSANLSIADFGKHVVLCIYNSVIASALICFVCFIWDHKAQKGIPEFLTRPGKHTLTILCYHMLIFAILIGGAGLVPVILGMHENVYLMSALKLCVIVFAMALFTRLGEWKRA